MDSKDGRLSDEARTEWLSKVNRFLKHHKKPRAARAKLQDRFLANKHHALAADHALLTTAGFGLESFVVDNPCHALVAGADRFFRAGRWPA